MSVIVFWKRSQMDAVAVPRVAILLPSLSGTLVVSGSCPGMCPPAVSLKHHNSEWLLIVFLSF